MNIYSCSLFAFSFGVLLIAILTVIKKQDKVARQFLLLSLLIFGYAFPGSIFYDQTISYDKAFFLARIFYVSAVFIPVAWIHFVFSFINKKEPFKYFYLLNYSVSFFLAILVQSPLFMQGLRPVMNLKYYTSPGPLYSLFPMHFFILVTYGFFCLMKALKFSEGQVKHQIKHLLLGTSIAFIISGLTFLPVYQINFPISLTTLMLAYPLFMGIALMKHGLFDYTQIADAFQREKLAAIGTMAASLNHELRNPLYIAKGKAESQLNSIDHGFVKTDEKVHSALKIIHQQLSRAMDIMQRFSDFAKPLSSNKDKERVVIKECVENVLQLVSAEFQMQKINLIEIPSNEFAIHANRRQVEEIFFNLIINACHALEEKGGDLMIRATQPNGKVRIEIEDNGSGIPKNDQKRIFDPFYSTKGPKGSGLGLYITKQLIEKNKGRIQVKSKPSKGTLFTLEFQSH
jgi:signal transduction histidine kinase